jgi:hypothetical protein
MFKVPKLIPLFQESLNIYFKQFSLNPFLENCPTIKSANTINKSMCLIKIRFKVYI